MKNVSSDPADVAQRALIKARRACKGDSALRQHMQLIDALLADLAQVSRERWLAKKARIA